jgi:hypothetical protein
MRICPTLLPPNPPPLPASHIGKSQGTGPGKLADHYILWDRRNLLFAALECITIGSFGKMPGFRLEFILSAVEGQA